MNELQSSLIKMLDSSIKGGAVYPASDELLKLAKHHNVLNAIYPVLDDDAKKRAGGYYAAFVNQQAQLDYYGEVILFELEKNGVKHMPLKGWHMKKLYPSPLLRSSCDLDIFYDKKDTGKVKAVLEGLGFSLSGDGENHMIHTLGAVTVEMHHDLLESEPGFGHYYDGIWDRLTRETEYRYNFNDEDFYIFMLLHMYKHFTHGGFGVRSVLDLYVFNSNKTLDNAYLAEEFEKLGITKFEAELKKLAFAWFCGGDMDKLSERLGDYIFLSGAYGTLKNRTVADLNKNDGNKAKYFFKRAFPPVSFMKKAYPSLKKCILHLPFMYIWRLLKAIFGKRGSVKNEIKSISSATDGERAALDALFEELDIKQAKSS